MRTGKLIFIEGVDALVNDKRASVLSDALEQLGFETLLFLSTDLTSLPACTVSRFKAGKLGKPEFMDPVVVSSLFQLKRAIIKDKILDALARPVIVICSESPYHTAATQAAKIDGWQRQKDFFTATTLSEMNTVGFPEPDKILFLGSHPGILDKARGAKKDKSERARLDGCAYNLYVDYFAYNLSATTFLQVEDGRVVRGRVLDFAILREVTYDLGRRLNAVLK